MSGMVWLVTLAKPESKTVHECFGRLSSTKTGWDGEERHRDTVLRQPGQSHDRFYESIDKSVYLSTTIDSGTSGPYPSGSRDHTIHVRGTSFLNQESVSKGSINYLWTTKGP